MKQKTIWTATLLGGTLAGMLLGLTATRLTPTVKAAPPATTPAATPAPAAAGMAELYNGKTYPLTLKAEQIDTSYHLVALVDQQGHASLYATRGETVTAGSEAFIVCYDVPLTNSQTRPAQPKGGTLGQLIYINLHAIQAMGNIIPISPPDTTAPAPAAAIP